MVPKLSGSSYIQTFFLKKIIDNWFIININGTLKFQFYI